MVFKGVPDSPKNREKIFNDFQKLFELGLKKDIFIKGKYLNYSFTRCPKIAVS